MPASVDKYLAWFGAASSVVAVGTAFETFTTLSLLSRLLLTGIAALAVIMALAAYLARWTGPEPHWGGREEDPPSNARLAAASLAIIAASAAFIYLAWLQTERSVLRIYEARTTEASTLTLHAPSRAVTGLTLRLQGPPTGDCTWRNISAEDFPSLGIEMIDWDTPNRQLHVRNFAHPQAIAVDCRPAANIAGGMVVQPETTERFRAGKLKTWRLVILALGGLVCLGGIWRLYSLSR